MSSTSHMKVLGVLSDREAVAQIGPAEMDQLFWISQFEVNDPDSPAPDKHGYQRQPIESRIPQIARYYLKPDARTTALTLSVRARVDEREDFEKMWDAGDISGIHERWDRAAVSVVDGQHRFLGLVEAWKQDPSVNPKVPVILNYGLTFAEEAEFFDLINSTQRKLPKALIEITKADVTEVDQLDHAQRVRLIATSLARHEDSVWHGQVNLTGARDPNKPVTFEGMRRSTSNMFPRELLDRLDNLGMNADTVARKFWGMVADACADAWDPEPELTIDEEGNEVEIVRSYRIRELVGVASIARLGRDMVASALEHEDFYKRLAQLVGKLGAVDWEKRKGNPWMASQAGFAGQKDLYSALYAWVYMDRSPLDE